MSNRFSNSSTIYKSLWIIFTFVGIWYGILQVMTLSIDGNISSGIFYALLNFLGIGFFFVVVISAHLALLLSIVEVSFLIVGRDRISIFRGFLLILGLSFGIFVVRQIYFSA